MDNFFLDLQKTDQTKLFEALKNKTGLSYTKLAKELGICRATVLNYHKARYRIPRKNFLKLCNLAKVTPQDYSFKLIQIDNFLKNQRIFLSSFKEETLRQMLNQPDWQKIVAVGFLTDGCIQKRKSDGKYSFTFFSSDLNLINCFQTMIKIGFNENGGFVKKYNNQNMFSLSYQRAKNSALAVNLFNFSETYKTNSAEKKPSLEFILNSNDEIKKIAVRFAMSTDGSVSIKQSKNQLSFALRLACAHPGLVKQWQQIFSDVGIDARIDMDGATYSGIHGIATSRKQSFLRFQEIGSFFPNEVKVTNGKFVGKRKNSVLAFICGCLTSGKRSSGRLKILSSEN